jgi:hypothetical protein
LRITPHVRVGDVRPRLGVVAVRARRLIAGAVPAPFPGRCGRVPGFLLGPLRVAARPVLGRQPVGGGGQPLPPLSPSGQRPRGRLVQLAAEPGVFSGVGRGCLGEQLADSRQRPVCLLRGVAGQLGPAQADRAQ